MTLNYKTKIKGSARSDMIQSVIMVACGHKMRSTGAKLASRVHQKRKGLKTEKSTFLLLVDRLCKKYVLCLRSFDISSS